MSLSPAYIKKDQADMANKPQKTMPLSAAPYQVHLVID